MLKLINFFKGFEKNSVENLERKNKTRTPFANYQQNIIWPDISLK